MQRHPCRHHHPKETSYWSWVHYSVYSLGVLALINSMRRRVYYTKSALLSNAEPDLALKSKHIRRLAENLFMILWQGSQSSR